MTRKHASLRVAFRTDAGIEIGTGHVMRCLTLASALKQKRAECVFLCREHDGHLLDFISDQGHEVVPLPVAAKVGSETYSKCVDGEPPHAHWLGTDWASDAAASLEAISGRGRFDWLVVDHYGLDACWEAELRPVVGRLMVIDDLNDRPHACDLLLDQTLGRAPENYAALVPPNTTLLLGSKYALLRPEFSLLREKSLLRRARPRLSRILVTMGGVDKDNATEQIISALDGSALPADAKISVVMGAKAPWLDRVRARAARMRHATEVLVAVRNMASLMAECDLAIGAGGTSTWERCSLGLPSVQVSLADNQRGINLAIRRANAAIQCEVSEVEGKLKKLFNDPSMHKRLTEMSKSAALVTDGQGVELVLRYLIKEET